MYIKNITTTLIMITIILLSCKDLAEEIKDLDREKPEVISVSPEPYYDKLLTSPVITVVFSKPMDIESLKNGITIKPKDSSETIPISVTNSESSEKFYITTNDSLKFEWYYVLSINTNAESLEGKPLREPYMTIYKTLMEQRYELKSVWGNSEAGAFVNLYSIDIDSSGNILVVDAAKGKVRKLNPLDGTLIKEWGHRDSEDGILDPMGLCIDKDNNVYVTDTIGGRIVKFDSNGTFITAFSSFLSGNPFQGPIRVRYFNNGIDEYLYVLEYHLKRIQVYDLKSNQVILSLNKAGSIPPASDELVEPLDVIMDKDKNIYVNDLDGYFDATSSAVYPCIKKYDINGSWVSNHLITINIMGTDYNFEVSSLAITPSNDLILSVNQFAGISPKFIVTDTNFNILSMAGSNDTNKPYSMSWGITFDRINNLIYVSDTQNTRILKYDLNITNSTFITSWDKVTNYSLFESRGIAIQRVGDVEYVYVTNSLDNEVRKYDYNGNWIDTIKGLSFPEHIAINSFGELFIYEDINRITKITQSGSSQVTLDSIFGTDTSNFQFADIAIDEESKLYLLDKYNKTITILDRNMNLVNFWDSNWANRHDVKSPTCIATSYIIPNTEFTAPLVYIVDSVTDSIKLFDPNGEIVYVAYGKDFPYSQFPYCETIALDRSNHIYLYESKDGNIQWLGDHGDYIAQVNTSPLLAFKITCNDYDNIYALSYLENSVYRYSLIKD